MSICSIWEICLRWRHPIPLTAESILHNWDLVLPFPTWWLIHATMASPRWLPSFDVSGQQRPLPFVICQEIGLWLTFARAFCRPQSGPENCHSGKCGYDNAKSRNIMVCGLQALKGQLLLDEFLEHQSMGNLFSWKGADYQRLSPSVTVTKCCVFSQLTTILLTYRTVIAIVLRILI